MLPPNYQHVILTEPHIHLQLHPQVIHIAAEVPLLAVGSAVTEDTISSTRHILNIRVPKWYMSMQPELDMDAVAAALGLQENYVGMQTAVDLRYAEIETVELDGIRAAAIVTAGLGNVIAAGSPQVGYFRPHAAGTINIVVLLDAAFTYGAMINAIITATEAKTLSLVARGIRTADGELASGTSTDAVIIACTDRGERMRYCGPATTPGYALSVAVRAALNRCLDSIAASRT